MIKISRLRLKNFKSFKKAELPFASGFTAIVGSNGSGKSNIFDALLFVLGISSMKALRAGKMIDLINHGADTDYATVEIEMKDSQKKFELSRSIDRSGKATVRLDGKKIGLNEAQSLLEELGVNATGHNIVAQGDITRIIEMTDIQRREIIDDMAGLREFDEKKEEALRELDKVDSKIKEVRIVLAERAAYLDQLQKERQAAMEFTSLGTELQQSKATLLKSEIERIEAGLKQNAEKTKNFAEENAEKEKKLSEERQELATTEQEIEALNQKIISAKEKTFSGIAVDAEEKKAEKRILLEREKNKEDAMQKNSKKISELEERNSTLEAELAEKKKKIIEKDAELSAADKVLRALKEEYAALSEKIQGKQEELTAAENEISGLNERLNGLREKYFEKKSWADAKRTISESKKKEFAALESELAEIEKKAFELQKKNDSLKALKAKHPNAEKELRQAEKAIEETSAKISYAASLLDSLEEAVEKLSKSTANCPTCETKLSAEKKGAILAKKQAEFKKIKAEQKQFSDTLAQKKALKKKLEEAIDEMNILSIEGRALEETMKRKQEATAKIADAKKAIGKEAGQALEKEIASIEPEIKGIESEISEKESGLSEEKRKTSFSAMKELSDKINSEMQKRNLLLQQKGEWELETEKLFLEEMERNNLQASALKKENREIEALREKEKQQIAAFEASIKGLEIELMKAEKASSATIEEKEKKSQKAIATKEKISKMEYSLREQERQKNEINIENSKLEVRLSDLQQEFAGFVEVQALKEFDAINLRKRIPEIERRIKELGAINLKAIERFGSQEQELLEIKAKSDKLEQERLAVLELINKIEVRRTEVFMDCFDSIGRNFNKIFLELADSQGKLTLSDLQMPLESGLLIEASFGKKEIKNIDLMSGGEKTLTALAFLFALQSYEPAPFYLFDEADAALDKDNSAKFARILCNISRTSQFISITHNDTVIKEADQIVGVALNKDKSSVIGLRLKEEIENNGNNGKIAQTMN